MKYPKDDLVGKTFGRLTVLEFVGRNKRSEPIWRVRCSCGSLHQALTNSLKNGHTKSCGCLKQDHMRHVGEKNRRHGHTPTENGKSRPTSEYKSWKHMKSRCLNPNATNYPLYGGRGVTIYEPWIESFEEFLAYLGPKPDPSYSIDRIDPDGDYEPGNVRWATAKEQRANQRPKEEVAA